MLGAEMLLKSLGITPEILTGLQNLVVQTAERLNRIEQRQTQILDTLSRFEPKLNAVAAHLIINPPAIEDHSNGTGSNG